MNINDKIMIDKIKEILSHWDKGICPKCKERLDFSQIDAGYYCNTCKFFFNSEDIIEVLYMAVFNQMRPERQKMFDFLINHRCIEIKEEEITRLEYYEWMKGNFKNISNISEVDRMYREDQFYKVLTITEGDKIISKKIIAWGYDGFDPEDKHGLIEYMLADYRINEKYDPYDCKRFEF